jgi:hypothetical protein
MLEHAEITTRAEAKKLTYDYEADSMRKISHDNVAMVPA